MTWHPPLKHLPLSLPLYQGLLYQCMCQYRHNTTLYVMCKCVTCDFGGISPCMYSTFCLHGTLKAKTLSKCFSFSQISLCCFLTEAGLRRTLHVTTNNRQTTAAETQYNVATNTPYSNKHKTTTCYNVVTIMQHLNNNKQQQKQQQ